MDHTYCCECLANLYEIEVEDKARDEGKGVGKGEGDGDGEGEDVKIGQRSSRVRLEIVGYWPEGNCLKVVGYHGEVI